MPDEGPTYGATDKEEFINLTPEQVDAIKANQQRTDVSQLIVQMHRPSRVITTNDGEVMVPVSWVRDLTIIYDLTASSALAQEDRNETDRYIQHVKTISLAIQTILEKVRPKV